MNSKEKVEKVIVAALCMERYPWEQGLLSQALIELKDYDRAYLLAYDAVHRQDSQGRLGTVYYTDHVAEFGDEKTVTDPALNGQAVFYFAQKNNDERFKKAAEKQLEYLLKTAPRAKNGALCHVSNAIQVWADSVHQGVPFIAQMGEYDEAVFQIRAMRELLYDAKTGLMKHSWDDTEQYFTSPELWGICNGLAMMGMAKVLKYLPQEKYASEREEIVGYITEMLDGAFKYQDESGMFHNNIDELDSFLEVDLAQEMVYTIYTGIKYGWLDEKKYKEKADFMRKVAQDCVDEWGFVREVCGSPTFAKLGTSAEAQAMFLQMEASAFELGLE